MPENALLDDDDAPFAVVPFAVAPLDDALLLVDDAPLDDDDAPFDEDAPLDNARFDAGFGAGILRGGREDSVSKKDAKVNQR